eukprot:10426622-Ditylum_brightwellii.AAC.1
MSQSNESITIVAEQLMFHHKHVVTCSKAALRGATSAQALWQYHICLSSVSCTEAAYVHCEVH